MILEDGFTQQLTQACEVANFPPDVKLNFVRDMFTEMDYKAETKAYYKDGFADGMSRGESKGIAKGIAKGMREKALDTAQRLLAAGIQPETIASCTGLSAGEVNSLSQI